jgi:hypothetical protein
MDDFSKFDPRVHSLFASAKPPQKFKCGGWTGCDDDHEFYAPADVLVLGEAVPLEDFRGHEHLWTQKLEDKAVENRTLYVGKSNVIPTLLGMWLEDASVN